MELPRHAEIWLPGYVRDRLNRIGLQPPKRVWVAIADHYEPYWKHADAALARERVQRWRAGWPQIAARSVMDSANEPPKYTFYYPQEEYQPELLDELAEMVHAGIADVEIHIHHDGQGRQDFIDRMSSFCHVLHDRHGLLRHRDGQLTFGFIHGNWALDNSLPGGKCCGLNDEITLLRDLGCYADFTMPSADSPTQSSTVNTIYWCKDDPNAPKSYDTGIPLRVGGGIEGDLLMVPGPLGLRWRERLYPRMENGELACYDPPTRYRAQRWFDLAPRIGEDVFIKLFAHGAQERHIEVLLRDALENAFSDIAAEANERGCSYYFVTTWKMYLAIDAIRRKLDPIKAVAEAAVATSPSSLANDGGTGGKSMK